MGVRDFSVLKRAEYGDDEFGLPSTITTPVLLALVGITSVN